MEIFHQFSLSFWYSAQSCIFYRCHHTIHPYFDRAKVIGQGLAPSIKLSYGIWLTPFQQAQRYSMVLLYSKPECTQAIFRLVLCRSLRPNVHAVMAAYGFSTRMTEGECVAELLKQYAELAKQLSLINPWLCDIFFVSSQQNIKHGSYGRD